jgi:hypothetical protein
MKEGENSAMAMTINRSQSLLTTNARLPVLAPPRTERIRLEALLADVWSRDILPLPGISNRSRNEHLVRASSVMRKLSVASLAGPFRKRSGSIGHSIKVPECSAGDPALENDVCSSRSSEEYSPQAAVSRSTPVEHDAGLPKRRRTTLSKRRNLASQSDCTSSYSTVRRLQSLDVLQSTPSLDQLRRGASSTLRMPSSSLILTASEMYGASHSEIKNECCTIDEKFSSSKRWTKARVAKNSEKKNSFRGLFR